MVTKRREHRSDGLGPGLDRPSLPSWWGARAHPWTLEGELQQLGDVAAASNHARGWRRVVARTVIIVILALVISTTLDLFLMAMFRMFR